MNVINITIKELKLNIRNYKTMTLMVLFPIILILILGTALTNMFDNTIQFKNINVIYTNSGTGYLSSGFNKFINESGTENGITFTQAESFQSGLDSVKNTKYAAFVNIKEDIGQIELYKNERYDFKANLVEALLSGFIQRYNVVAEIYAVNPLAAGKVAGRSIGDYVKPIPMDEKHQPNSMDYYAITMLTLIIMYSALTGMWSIKTERTKRTINRLVCSPVRKYEILAGKILGCFVITLFQAGIVILFSSSVLKTYWGDNMGTVFALVAAEIIMAVSVGIGVGFIIKSDSASSGALNLIIPIVVFLGGGYVPVETFNIVLVKISDISPLRWINKAIFQVVFSSDFSSVAAAISINLLLAAVLTIISSIKFKKEAA